jgi:hypothetical protein
MYTKSAVYGAIKTKIHGSKRRCRTGSAQGMQYFHTWPEATFPRRFLPDWASSAVQCFEFQVGSSASLDD